MKVRTGLQFVIILICMLVTVLTGCRRKSAEASANGSQRGQDSKEFHVAYAAVTTSLAPWVVALANEFGEMCKRNDWKYDIYDGEGNPTVQTEQINSIISDGDVDMVVLFPVDGEVGVQYVKDLTSAGIGVITMGSDVAADGQALVKCYVGPDQAGMVNIATDYVKEIYGPDKPLNYVILSGFDVQYDYILREKAVNDGFAGTKYNQLAVSYCGASRDVAMEKMANYLVTYNNLDFVACLSDEFALGAIQAIDEAGKTGQIMVVSIECFKASIPMIKEGKLAITVTMTGRNTILRLEEVLKAYLRGETPDYSQFSLIEPVTKATADSVSPEY
ncbi:MAG: sugar ABC transporter substrate-binding protein [Treponema sp.]|jgi:ribose transport system substrate-binding protein|nr:sugar ABC transporter substrate-binding protein [Treponema sp.]